MALTVKQATEAVCRAAGELEWEPHYTSIVQADHAGDGKRIGEAVTRTCFEFENWTNTAGQNIIATAFMDGADIGSLFDSLDNAADSFDPDKEAEMMIREVGLGNRGLPSSVSKLIDDMKEAEAMMLNFANQMRQELECLTEEQD